MRQGTQTGSRKAELGRTSSRCPITHSILATRVSPPLHSSYVCHTAALGMFQSLRKLPRWQESGPEKRSPVLYKLAADPGSEARSALKPRTFLW